MKHITYKAVLQRIQDLTSLIDVSANKPRLRRLIRKAAIDSMAAISLITQNGVKVDIVNGMGELPCDLIRLLRVHPSNQKYRSLENMEPNNTYLTNKYDHNNHMIKHSSVRTGSVYIDYYAIPLISIEDNGKMTMDIAIHPDQLDYCAYEAARIVMFDMVNRKQLDKWAYEVFDQRAEWGMNVAVGSTNKISIDQAESMAWMQRNAHFFNLK